MKRSSSGFTMIELVIVILIGSILTGIALTSFAGAQSAFAARGGKTTFSSLQARARAQAIEMGENVLMNVDATGDSVWLVHDGTVLEKVMFGGELDVDIRAYAYALPTPFSICFTPRGFSDFDCGTTGVSIVRLEFWRGVASDTLWVLPFGQLWEN